MSASLVGWQGGLEVWAVGRVAFVIPTISEEMPTALKDALAVRRSAMLTGTCACGARLLIVGDPHGHPAAVRMDHEPQCTAHDRHVRDLIKSHGWRSGS